MNTKTSLVRDFVSLQNRVNRMMDELSGPFSIETSRNGGFVPACDVEESNNHYLITMDVPGVPKEKIQVELSGDTLTVTGEQEEEYREEKGTRKRFERCHGQFQRSFTLPGMGAAESIEADYKNGVLRIAVPKSESATSRRIPISEGKSGFLSKAPEPAEKRREGSPTKAA